MNNKSSCFYLLSLIIVITLFSCGKNNELVEVEIPKREEFIAPKKSEFDISNVKTKQGPFEMFKLPYTYEEVGEIFDPEEMKMHYQLIHLDYANALNTALHNTELVNDSLVGILNKVHNTEDKIAHLAGAFYNHNFFWQSISKTKTTSPNADLISLINQSFGSYTNMKSDIVTRAMDYKGVGWLWLIKDRANKLQLVITNNNLNPISLKLGTPLLVIDLWEHAYLTTYNGNKEKYIKAILPHLNWDFAASNLSKSL